MVSRFVATWRNIGNAGMLDAYNRGSALATRQITEGLGGVGTALEEYGNKIKTKNTGDILEQMANAKDQASLDAIKSDSLNIDGEKVAAAKNLRSQQFSATNQWQQIFDQKEDAAVALSENRKSQLDNTAAKLAISGRLATTGEEKQDLLEREYNDAKATKDSNAAMLDNMFGSPSVPGAPEAEQNLVGLTAQPDINSMTKEQQNDFIKKSFSHIDDPTQRKNLETQAFNRLGISPDKATNRANQERKTYSSFVTDMKGVETLEDYAAGVGSYLERNPDKIPMDFISKAPNKFVNLAAKHAINSIGIDTANDLNTELLDSLKSLDGNMNTEQWNERSAKAKALISSAQAALYNSGETLSGMNLDYKTEKLIEDKVTGSGTLVGQASGNYKLLKERLSEVAVNRNDRAFIKSEKAEVAQRAYLLKHDINTLPAAIMAKHKNATEFLNDADEIKVFAEDLINNSTAILKDNPSVVIDAIKSIVSITDSKLPLAWNEVVRNMEGNTSAIVDRAMKLYNSKVKAGEIIEPSAETASQEILDLFAEKKKAAEVYNAGLKEAKASIPATQKEFGNMSIEELYKASTAKPTPWK